uniref:Tudor domain-containing protein n=1 Tax=Panagrolaimus sp. PS1159 TaxID=55785 RepID=A0AC35F4C8_9BILA
MQSDSISTDPGQIKELPKKKPRSFSPYLKRSKDKESKIPVFITKPTKIQRIRCHRNYNAIVKNVVSPSEIWIQVLNNISDKLILPTSNAPMLETELIENKYVMTPIDEETLVRGRIIAAQDGRALIRLIDHGIAVWRDDNTVFKMPQPLYSFPWQSRVVMLHGIKPKNQNEWTAEETEAIKRVFAEFDYVYVKPILSQFLHVNEDREAFSVSMIGLNGSLQQSIFDVNGSRILPEAYGIDITELYNFFAFSTLQYLIDARDQEYYDYPYKFEDAYLETYQPFNIIPNPNNTYKEESIGFNKAHGC